MNKQELVNAIADAAEITKAAAEKSLNALINCVTSALKENDKITIPGFGSWEVSKRAARVGRNPQTGKEIKIAAANVPRFKAGKKLKDEVNSIKN
jgi:DNA-binding protein HU-beta